jgi:hypothetical protein
MTVPGRSCSCGLCSSAVDSGPAGAKSQCGAWAMS